jgi:hypothetical protein
MKTAILILLSSSALAQSVQPGVTPSSSATAAKFVSSAGSGSVAFEAVTGTKWCFNSPTDTVCFSLASTTLTLSGTTNLHVTSGLTVDGFSFFVGAQFSSNVIVQGTLQIGTSGNAITASYSATSVIDFASTTTTTADSSGITVTGAVVGSPCIVGVPIAAAVTGASFTCYVSATDTVKVRFTATGAAVDPASGTFTVRTF